MTKEQTIFMNAYIELTGDLRACLSEGTDPSHPDIMRIEFAEAFNPHIGSWDIAPAIARGVIKRDEGSIADDLRCAAGVIKYFTDIGQDGFARLLQNRVDAISDVEKHVARA